MILNLPRPHLTLHAFRPKPFPMEKGWAGLPYYPISESYTKRFGEKVYKIPVSVVDTCPNRMGLKGMETCVFCDIWGSAAKSESFELSLPEQIEKYRGQIANKFNVKSFLAYFQAYTNSFTKIQALRDNFETVLAYEFIKGFVIGTRPDCISPALLKLWTEYHERSFVAVEFGVQSFFDDDLLFLKRGHSRKQSLDAILKVGRETPVDLGIHLIFGTPFETPERIIETAELCNTLPISNVKLHNLHVLEHTPLAEMFRRGEFTPIEREPYAENVKLFLQHLRPDIAIHRLSALSSRWDELISPLWTRDKMGTHQFIVDYLRQAKSYQSQHYIPTTEEEKILCQLRKEKSQWLPGPPQA